MLGTFGKFGVLSFNGNKMITTSGGGALVCPDETEWQRIMWLATQARESYPYYQHEVIGYNYRMSNICAGIGRGQMTIVNDHIAHHKYVMELYRELLNGVSGIEVHGNPDERYESNFWLNTITIAPEVRIKGQENAYQAIVKNQLLDFDQFLSEVDLVVIMVKHDHIKQNWDKLKGKVVLDCHNICPMPDVYHI